MLARVERGRGKIRLQRCRVTFAMTTLFAMAQFCEHSRSLANIVPLLGAGIAWHFKDWRYASDVLRGGSSSGSLKMSTEDDSVEFQGHLVRKPGTKPFAQALLQAKFLPDALRTCHGLRADISKADNFEYSVLLQMRGAPSGATYEFSFRPEGSGLVDMPFHEFVPKIYGNPAPKLPRLELSKVEYLTLQVQGGESEGPFSLQLRSLSGLMGKEFRPPPERWVCRACGTMNHPSVDTCIRCGCSREDEVAKLQAKIKEQEAAGRWECPGCGALNYLLAGECRKCGTPKP